MTTRRTFLGLLAGAAGAIGIGSKAGLPTRPEIPPVHEHAWIEVTHHGSWQRQFQCAGCGASKAEPLEPLVLHIDGQKFASVVNRSSRPITYRLDVRSP